MNFSHPDAATVPAAVEAGRPPGNPSPGAEPVAPRLDSTAVYRLLALFVSSRLLILATAVLSRAILIKGVFEDHVETLAGNFFRWDSAWYLRIVVEGYSYDPNQQSTVAFYPLYPLLLWALSRLGVSPLAAGYLISNAALFGAALVVWQLLALETRSKVAAESGVLLLLFYPGSLWCSMIYTEGLFLFVTLSCLLAARRRHWLLTALAGYAGALTRAPGLLTGTFLAVEAFQQWRDDRRAGVAADATRISLGRSLLGRWRTWLGVASPALGHATYLIYLQVRFGDWRAQQKTFAAGWHIPPFQPPWRVLRDNWEYLLEPFFRAVTFPMIGLMLALSLVALFAFRRRGYAALMFVLLALYITSTNYHDFTRYTTTIAPIYLVLGYLAERLPVLKIPLLVFSTMLLVLLTALLVNGYHIN